MSNKVSTVVCIIIKKSGTAYNTEKPPLGGFAYKINLLLFCFCNYFLHFGYHALHHTFNTCFQGNH